MEFLKRLIIVLVTSFAFLFVKGQITSLDSSYFKLTFDNQCVQNLQSRFTYKKDVLRNKKGDSIKLYLNYGLTRTDDLMSTTCVLSRFSSDMYFNNSTNVLSTSLEFNDNGGINSMYVVNDEMYQSYNVVHFTNGAIKSYTRKLNVYEAYGKQYFYHSNGFLKIILDSDSSSQFITEYHNNGMIKMQVLAKKIGSILYFKGDYLEFSKEGKITVKGSYSDTSKLEYLNLDSTFNNFGDYKSNNLKIGLWRYYDEDGHLRLKEWYNNEGVKIKIKHKGRKDFDKPKEILCMNFLNYRVYEDSRMPNKK